MLKFTLKPSWALLAPLFLLSQSAFAMGPIKPIPAPSATPSTQCLELNRFLAPHVSKEFFSKSADEQIEELKKVKSGFTLTDIEIDPQDLRKISKRALNEFLGQFLHQSISNEGRDLYISVAAQRGCEAMNYLEAMGGMGAVMIPKEGSEKEGSAAAKPGDLRFPEADFPIRAGRADELKFSIFEDTDGSAPRHPSTHITVRKTGSRALDIETAGLLPSLRTQATSCQAGSAGKDVSVKARFRMWVGEKPANTEVSDRLLVLLTQLAEETANTKGDGCEAIYDRAGVLKRPMGGGSTSEYQPSSEAKAGSAI